ncbi:hypothetical protein P7K49_040656 [Saguinus oedipus]|uniref:Uncharacterized protein n=1 Tax=Saguinus oedipus TaxID=9490 RepID=A0ABQ9T939_SAGOE|nr:hypothetical protein P7K49_040656 [Saguinus oedipus]
MEDSERLSGRGGFPEDKNLIRQGRFYVGLGCAIVAVGSAAPVAGRCCPHSSPLQLSICECGGGVCAAVRRDIQLAAWVLGMPALMGPLRGSFVAEDEPSPCSVPAAGRQGLCHRLSMLVPRAGSLVLWLRNSVWGGLVYGNA